ncbi:MAG TPA: carbon-nitrogen hydrolase family protein [Anaerolineales bacterium]|nr:carbon-nitrogen hydrolase family protein [Anaerolineales bacterium]HRK87585.1 carbon-nitrogen hydrolase family protein [Anaerolineales bacterium]
MAQKTKIRAAAVQFGVVADVAANLQTCLRMIDEAAKHKPDVMVLPEFVNHIAWYRDAAHCYGVAVSLDDDFIQAIGRKAKEHGCYIKINVTLKRDDGKVSGTNVLFDPAGNVVGLTDKQILMGNENNFLEKSTTIAPILETELGHVGMYACMDGVIPEVARALAVRKPQILLNSLNSFAHDEASLHIPVRAAENKVFVVAANKVGSLVPEEMREAVAARLKIDPSFLEGAGESQIVAPDGTVLAKAPMKGEAVVFADIDLSEADNKLRPDGTDIMSTRRPELYAPLGVESKSGGKMPGAESLLAGVGQVSGQGKEALDSALKMIAEGEKAGVKLIVLPELFHITNLDAQRAEKESVEMIRALQSDLKDAYVATSIVEDGAHVGVLFNKSGVVLKQPQLHKSGRHAWSKLGDEVNVFDADWGRVALVIGNDAIYPETFRLAALKDVEVVAVPTLILEKWEVELGFKERAAENRMNVIVASKSDSGIYAITEDFTLWTEWKNRPFDGNINYPVITMAQGDGLTVAEIHPAASVNKMVSQKTDVLNGRPWKLAEPLVSSKW